MKIHFIVIFTICSVFSCTSRQDNLVKVTRINSKVVTFEYLNVNVTAIKSKTGILIIDTNRSPWSMKKIMGQIEKEFGRKDFLYIINTHGDYDHCSGNQIFPDAIIIGQEMCPGYMQHFPANTPQAIRRFRQDISDMKKNLKNNETDIQDLSGLREKTEACNLMLESIENDYRVTPPSMTFKDSLILNLDDITVRMFYCGKAHTDNDIMIYIPEEKVVFTGDLFNSKYNFGFSVNKTDNSPRLINLMNKILLDPSGLEYVIRGHGEYLSGIDFASLRDLLAERSFRK